MTAWPPQLCTAESHCPRPDCLAKPGEHCLTDRPVHLERFDLWSGRCVKEQCERCFCAACEATP